MKENTLRDSLLLLLLGIFIFLVALWNFKSIDNFWISLIATFPIVSISFVFFFYGCYGLLKATYKKLILILKP
jgi:hypothetical protein